MGFQLHDDIFSGQRKWYRDVHEYVRKLQARYPVMREGTSSFLCDHYDTLPIRELHREFAAFWNYYDHKFGVRLGTSDRLTDAAKPSCAGRFANFMDAQPGDFILAHRDAWHRIGGPPMLPQNMYVDYLLVCRLASFFRQVVISE